MLRRSAFRSILLERERQEDAREKKQQVKEESSLSRRKRRTPVSIQVQILTGRRFPLLIEPLYDHLLDLKKKIQIKEGIHPDVQILLLNGVRLEEGPIRDLFITEGACFFLTLRNRGG